MAKTNMVEREKRRAKIVKKYAAKRALLKELIRSPKTNSEVRADAQQKLQKLPRDASPSRGRNRCAITGRSRHWLSVTPAIPCRATCSPRTRDQWTS